MKFNDIVFTDNCPFCHQPLQSKFSNYALYCHNLCYRLHFTFRKSTNGISNKNNAESISILINKDMIYIYPNQLKILSNFSDPLKVLNIDVQKLLYSSNDIHHLKQKIIKLLTFL